MTSMPTTTTAGRTPLVTAPATTCPQCHGTGWTDPFTVHDGAPPFTWCPECLGAGLDDCTTCAGDGAVPVATPCPACDGPA